MEQYDVVVVGGGIAGSVAARFAAEHGFATLLIEKRKTPRNKSCSGIQFPYLEKLVGAPIPPDKLCQNELRQVEIVTPSGRAIPGQMKMLNFWRSTFDSWLNDVAAAAGAEFQDETRLLDFQPDDAGLDLCIRADGQEREVRARYLIAADGLYSRIRKQLRPDDFGPRATGGTVNYYCMGETSLDPHTLYMIYNVDLAPLMFAWAYLKDDQWVIGTGANESPRDYADRLWAYIQERYGFHGEIVRKEGFSSPLVGGIFLGEGRLLFAGDAANLVDAHRGLGMDNAALSARQAVRAIIAAERNGQPAADHYQHLMKSLVHKLQANDSKQAQQFASNDHLEAGLTPASLLKGGVLMKLASLANTMLPPERVITLPL
ncbi:MAG: NAD(P)/FAD-dependent oxidoreductase [Chloroflexi bacterium]|nr:NAD(P)/FAD-dependent oxidoreductase [Chloroflexota bacterium]MBU1747708.1 NAD(P)/FAD-dependent oxidoreductase [Chloroflexota bacterium]